MAAKVILSMHFHNTDEALQTLLTHRACLRPVECMGLRFQDVLPPGGQVGKRAHVSLPSDGGCPTKTHVGDDTVMLDDPVLAGPVAVVACNKPSRTGVLVRPEPGGILPGSGKKRIEPSFHRHCSFTICDTEEQATLAPTGPGPMLEILARGRWRSQASML